jgi:hypothetical protein
LTGPLLILTALRYEGKAIAKRLRLSFSTPTSANGLGPAGKRIELRVVGPRCQGLAWSGELEGYRLVIMAGFGGALDPTLEIGDVVVDRNSDIAAPNGPWRRGDIHTALGVVASVADKCALFGETGALVADMEKAIARTFAAEHGVPFLGIRAVSDRADEPLDPATLRWVDAAGALRPLRLAADLCRRPARIPELWRLGRRSRIAVQNLADAVARVVIVPPDEDARQDSMPSQSRA